MPVIQKLLMIVTGFIGSLLKSRMFWIRQASQELNMFWSSCRIVHLASRIHSGRPLRNKLKREHHSREGLSLSFLVADPG